MKKFSELNINPSILEGIEKMDYQEMTEVQEKVIPVALDDKDVIVQAPTGTGKTIAFAIPILEKIDASLDKVQALVISPTRELAVQIAKEINTVSKCLDDVNALAVYGGEIIDKQIYNLKKRPKIIVATPGRLMDHLERRTIRLNDVKMVVLDEADEMLNMGFIEDITSILERIPCEHQTMLFSATISKDIEKIANQFLINPTSIKISKNRLTVDLIEQRYIDVKEKDKIEVISRILDINDYKLVMIFCNTKKSVDDVTSALLMRGTLVEALHGDMKQMQRDRVMSRFRNGQINVLVASDVAARGLDIDDVDVVFNYDVPTDEEYYVHRIGRTGRAKKTGLSITLVTRQEKSKLRSIMSYTKSSIEQMMIPSLEKVMKVRVKKIMLEAITSLENDNNLINNYINKEMSKIDGVDKDQLIKGLIALQLLNKNQNQEVEEVKEEIEDRKKKRSKKVARIFANVGKKDNFKVYTLTDLLTKKTDMTNAEIDNVEIHDNFSFFEIPEDFVKDLTNSPIDYKGRKITFEVAKAKEKSSKEKKSSKQSSKPNDRKRKSTSEKNKKTSNRKKNK